MSEPNLEEIERDLVDLNNGVLTVTGRLVDASNATLYAMCSVNSSGADREFPCIYKPIAGERPLWRPCSTSSRSTPWYFREPVRTLLTTRLLGPPTCFRTLVTAMPLVAELAT